VSAASAADFARTYAMKPSRIVTIPRGIVCGELAPREERRQRLATEAGVDAAEPMLVHVGSFTPEKNHRWLIEAFGRVVKQRRDASLILIGEGPLMSEVRAVIGRWELGGRVRLLGSRPDADDLAGGGDVLLLPSLTEGLPGVVLEAAAREVPAIACDVGGVSEAIEDGRTGFLVPSGDLDAFVERIEAMLDAPEQARRMGVAARAHVCARFDLPSVVDAFESLYRQLVPCPVGSASSI
jgi:glycosyltransferase involved in cell wall biosynthesis